MPGGALGTYRFPKELAFVVTRAHGSKLYDVSGREYIDYLLGSGPLILGHAHPLNRLGGNVLRPQAGAGLSKARQDPQLISSPQSSSSRSRESSRPRKGFSTVSER